jgi:hypothetical protein
MPRNIEKPRPGQLALERFIKSEIAREYRSVRRFLKQTGYPNGAFYRVVAGESATTDEQRWRLEGALDLPRNVLDYIADGNIEALERTSLDPDQLRVIVELLDTDTGETQNDIRDIG